MKNEEIHKNWINAAYIEFAEYGPEFSIKALSKKTNLPRTTFYYHYLSKDDLISEVLYYHSKLNDQFQIDLSTIDNLIPDLYKKLFIQKTGVKFHKQLLINSHIDKFRHLYRSENLKSVKTLVPFIKKQYGFLHNDEDVCQFYNTLTDAWYAQLDFSDFCVDYMVSLAGEIVRNILKLNSGSKY